MRAVTIIASRFYNRVFVAGCRFWYVFLEVRRIVHWPTKLWAWIAWYRRRTAVNLTHSRTSMTPSRSDPDRRRKSRITDATITFGSSPYKCKRREQTFYVITAISAEQYCHNVARIKRLAKTRHVEYSIQVFRIVESFMPTMFSTQSVFSGFYSAYRDLRWRFTTPIDTFLVRTQSRTWWMGRPHCLFSVHRGVLARMDCNIIVNHDKTRHFRAIELWSIIDNRRESSMLLVGLVLVCSYWECDNRFSDLIVQWLHVLCVHILRVKPLDNPFRNLCTNEFSWNVADYARHAKGLPKCSLAWMSIFSVRVKHISLCEVRNMDRECRKYSCRL